MGLTKTDGFARKELQAASIAKALGHPARIAVLNHLVETKSCICGDIVQELPLSQSTVSQHLKELREVGLIKGNVAGTSVCYCIDEKGWARAREAMIAFFDRFQGNDCC